MTPDEITKLEAELKQRESLLQARKEELDRRAAEMGKAVDSNPTPQNPSTYVSSVKTIVAITLDLQDSNYIKWRELFLVALGRYGLTSSLQCPPRGSLVGALRRPASWGLDQLCHRTRPTLPPASSSPLAA